MNEFCELLFPFHISKFAVCSSVCDRTKGKPGMGALNLINFYIALSLLCSSICGSEHNIYEVGTI